MSQASWSKVTVSNTVIRAEHHRRHQRRKRSQELHEGRPSQLARDAAGEQDDRNAGKCRYKTKADERGAEYGGVDPRQERRNRGKVYVAQRQMSGTGEIVELIAMKAVGATASNGGDQLDDGQHEHHNCRPQERSRRMPGYALGRRDRLLGNQAGPTR